MANNKMEIIFANNSADKTTIQFSYKSTREKARKQYGGGGGAGKRISISTKTPKHKDVQPDSECK